ncbi:MAG TPA: SRPBCC family protein, partial [Gemmatimonadaceae bacterium]|nr:SRPBCC family protein [Gemmatimonadaceae bacterium]
EHLKQWFTPAPWKTVECEIDLRPGGIFRTVMQSPEGERYPHVGCYLEVVENERLVWTDALLSGYRPANHATSDRLGLTCFTAVITLEPYGTGTKYTATAMHKNDAERKHHEELGFHQGWGTALDQLVALVKDM